MAGSVGKPAGNQRKTTKNHKNRQTLKDLPDLRDFCIEALAVIELPAPEAKSEPAGAT